MKEFNYVDTDSVKVSDEMAKGIEKGLAIRAIRSLIAGEKNVEVTIDGDTFTVTHEISEHRRSIGDPINGNYIAIYATTDEHTYLFVRINEWCNIYSSEFVHLILREGERYE